MKGLMIQIGDDGIAREYSTKYDVSIHCESEEEKKKVEDMLHLWRPKDGNWEHLNVGGM